MGKICISASKRKLALTGKTVWVVRPVRYSTFDTEDVANMAASDSGIQSTQVLASFEACARQIEQLVLNGHSVRLGKIGIISLSVKAKSVENKDDISATNIKSVSLNLRPSTYLKEKIDQIQFSTSIADSDSEESKG